MLNAYSGLMKSAPQGMQATPVHHVGKTGTLDAPETGSPKDQAIGFLGEIESHMGKFRPGSHAHNQLSQMRGQLLMDIPDMDVEHQAAGDSEALQNLTTRFQNLKGRMVAPQRGITAEGKPVR